MGQHGWDNKKMNGKVGYKPLIPVYSFCHFLNVVAFVDLVSHPIFLGIDLAHSISLQYLGPAFQNNNKTHSYKLLVYFLVNIIL